MCSFGCDSLLRFVHAETSEILENDIVVIVGIVRVLVAMAFDGLHLFHCVDTLALDGSYTTNTC